MGSKAAVLPDSDFDVDAPKRIQSSMTEVGKYKNGASARAVAWARKNRDRSLEIKRRYRERNPGAYNAYRNAKPLKQLIKSAKASAKLRGIPFSITEGDLSQPGECPVLGIPIDWSYGQKGGARADSPSIDRLDNSIGYTPANVRVISYRANTLKSNATLDEILALARYMSEEAGPR